MSNVQGLDIAVKELRMAAQSLINAADSLAAMFNEAADDAQTVNTPPNEPEPQKPITREEVRSVLTRKAAAGFGEQVRALLGKYGVKKVSDLGPGDCAALMEEAEGIGNG